MTMQDNPNKLNRLIENGLYYEYTKAADPIGSGAISQIPFAEFGSKLHETGGTQIIPLDISDQLACEGPATRAPLCARTLHIRRFSAGIGKGQKRSGGCQPKPN